MRTLAGLLAAAALSIGGCCPPRGDARPAGSSGAAVGAPATGSCFLLYEVGVGEVRRSPSEACATRVTPASTFKIPHALAALDSGVLGGTDVPFAYDGVSWADGPAIWRRDHTLATAFVCTRTRCRSARKP